MEAAASAIARRPRTTEELRIWLARRGYPKTDISRALARMRELGYLDDADYAASFVTGRAAGRGWGPERVRQELARRGVGNEIIETALARAAEQGSAPSANIARALAKHVRLRGLPRDRKERDRLFAALRRQGFSFDAIREAVEDLTAAGDGESGEDP